MDLIISSDNASKIIMVKRSIALYNYDNRIKHHGNRLGNLIF